VSLTGRGLIVLSATLTVLVAAATVWLWRRGGWWRSPIRIAGLVTIETLIVLTAGLILNRSERFYPSWQALTASHPTETAAARQIGRLDHALAVGNVLSWSPPEESRWRLATTPLLIVPVDYARHPDRSYPVIVVLIATDRAAAIRAQAAAMTDALTVIAVPTPTTTAADLATLPARLAQDTRATGTGWAIVADPAHTTLARQWNTLAATRFRLITTTLEAALDRLPPPLNTPIRPQP